MSVLSVIVLIRGSSSSDLLIESTEGSFMHWIKSLNQSYSLGWMLEIRSQTHLRLQLSSPNLPLYAEFLAIYKHKTSVSYFEMIEISIVI